MPSMSLGLSPASAMALSAASACNWICDMSGMTPSRVVSAAPTMAIDFGFMGSSPSRVEEREGDFVVELLESDLDRHVELQRLGGLRAAGDVGELDNGQWIAG
jgi:hypothetical protein